jgi:lipid-binding SYLF domain-containing protein
MKVVGVLILSCLSSLVWAAQTREDVTKRLERAAEVLSDIMKAPDKGIPKEILAKAKCVAVVPSMVKVAVGIGGEHAVAWQLAAQNPDGAHQSSSQYLADHMAFNSAQRAPTLCWWQ